MSPEALEQLETKMAFLDHANAVLSDIDLQAENFTYTNPLDTSDASRSQT